MNRILFLGDSDTSLLLDFSREAVRLAKKIAPLPVLLPRIKLNHPGKGIDDVRGKLSGDFPAYWEKLVRASHQVEANDTASRLCVRLLKKEDSSSIRNIITGEELS